MSTKCKGCGHTLTSAESIRRGYGPKCFKEATEDQQSTHRQYTDRVNDAVSGINMEPVAAYIVLVETFVFSILNSRYDLLSTEFRPRLEDKLEVRVYADFITYQEEASDVRHTLVDMAHDVQLFTKIKNELKKPQAGVTPISVQEEMGLAV